MNDLEFAELLNGLPDEMLAEAYQPRRKKHHVIYMISAAAACFAAVIAAAVYAKLSVEPPDRIPGPAMTTDSRSAHTTAAVTATAPDDETATLPHSETRTEPALTAQTEESTSQSAASAAHTEQSDTAQSSTTSVSAAQTTYSTDITSAVSVSYTRTTTVTAATAEQTETSESVSYSTVSVTMKESLPTDTEPLVTSETYPPATSRGYETSCAETSGNSGSHAPEQIEIALYFLDEANQQPVSGAEIQVFDLEGNLLTETVTDGEPVRLTMLEGDGYRVHISAVPEGYSLSRRNYLFTAGSEPVRIYLKPQ